MKSAFEQLANEYGIAIEQLTVWVERSWIRPDQREGEVTFTDIDRARLRMIIEFQRDLAIDEETMPVVLGLLDRLYAARAHLQAVMGAVAEMPEAAQIAVVRRLREDFKT